MILWDNKIKQIGLKLRVSTIEAMEFLDKNKFPNRTDYISRCIEHDLIKRGLLASKAFTEDSLKPDKDMDEEE